MAREAALIVLASAAVAAAHPMGNFSVGQHSTLTVSPSGVRVAYVLDLAEMPTYELRPGMGIGPAAAMAPEVVERFRARAADEWVGGLSLAIDGAPVALRVEGGRALVTPGAGGLPTARFEVTATAAWPAGAAKARSISYEDRNYPDRVGWKEIVLRAATGATVVKASVTDRDGSAGLTKYPDEAAASPPQVRSATATVEVEAAPIAGGPTHADGPARWIALLTAVYALVGLAAATSERARGAPAGAGPPPGPPAHPPPG